MTMGPPLRRLALATHVTVSGGWIGAVIAYLVLDVVATAGRTPGTIRAAYIAMSLIASWAIVPLALASLATGIGMALGTPWGLWRHYWIVISLVLTSIAVVVLLLELPVITSLAQTAADPGTSVQDLRSLPGTWVHSAGGLLILVVVNTLNVYKPRGLTRYGRKRTRDQR